MQDGTANKTVPDPFYKMSLTKKQIDEMIDAIDEDILNHEGWRRKTADTKIDAFPEFSRLNKGARKAMVQELHRVIEYRRDHIDEYLVEDDGVAIDYNEYPLFNGVYFSI